MSEPTVVLNKLIPIWALPDISPFCIKVETYLRMAQIPYSTRVANMRKAPKGKVPFLEDGQRVIPDSTRIVEYLEATRNAPLDSWLTPAQIALATAVRSMIEEHLYWVLVYQRWQDERGWAIYRPVVIDLLAAMGFPRFLGPVISLQSRRILIAQLRAQGMGRHTGEEVTAAGVRIIDTLAQLFQAPFFLGDRISTLDATAYAFLESIAGAPFDGPFKDHLCRQPQLRGYCDHMRALYFS